MKGTIESEHQLERVQGFLGEMDKISQEMVSGNLQAVSEMKELLRSEDSASKYKNPTLFVSEAFLHHLWDKFGVGITGVHLEDEPCLVKIAKSLGSFIQAGAFNPTGEKGEPFEKLGELLGNYASLIKQTERRVEEKPYEAEDWIVLTRVKSP